MTAKKYYVRLRKYIRHKKDIMNTLYRRYTLSNRGNTPMSFNTRNLHIRFDFKKRKYYYSTLYSRRVARIYHINGKNWRFDFSSCMAPEGIVALSKSLDPSNIRAVICNENQISDYGMSIEYYSLFSNTQGKGYGVGSFYTPVDLVERSTMFYPGVYYSRGLWLWTDSLSDHLYYMEGRKVREVNSDSFYTTDYTTGDDLALYKAQLCSRMYYIYIPFDSIKTTVLQAYLPLSINPQLYMNLYDRDSSDVVGIITNTVFWMGKPIQLFGFDDYNNPTRLYKNRTIQGKGESIAPIICDIIYHNMIPIDAGLHHLSRNF